MTSVFAHVLGLPVEETVAQIVPFGVALLVALRVSVRRMSMRRSRNSRGEP
jgi:hypothetical protein